MWIQATVAREQAGSRLDKWLASAFGGTRGVTLSRGAARRLIDGGAVFVERKRVRVASRTMHRGWSVFLDLPDDAMEASTTSPSSLSICYEDEDMVAVHKAVGLASQGVAGRVEPNVITELTRFLWEREGCGDTLPYLALHHRLDRMTSGVMVLARSRRANAGLARAFRERLAHKRYVAIVERVPAALRAEKRVLRSWIGRLDRRRWGSVERAEGRLAISAVRLFAIGEETLALEAMPHTGRTHQIRVHLAESGTPILGDTLYGPRSRGRAKGESPRKRPGRLLLHAVSIELPHPVTGDPLRVESPLPEDFMEALGADPRWRGSAKPA